MSARAVRLASLTFNADSTGVKGVTQAQRDAMQREKERPRSARRNSGETTPRSTWGSGRAKRAVIRREEGDLKATTATSADNPLATNADMLRSKVGADGGCSVTKDARGATWEPRLF